MVWLKQRIAGIYRHDGRRKLFSNVVALSVLQAANYILPLITVPYLVRVLGAERFGLVMFAAAFNMYFVMLSDVGFDLSATRAVALSRDRLDTINEIFSSVTIIKTAVLVIGFLILVGLVMAIDRFRSEYAVFLISYLVTVGQAYFPTWFFSGMEHMRLVTILNVVAKLAFALLIFVVVRRPEDYLYVPLMNAFGFAAASAISMVLVIRKFGVKLRIPPWSTLVFRLRESAHFFVSRASVSIYDNSNTFVVGLVLGNVAAGYYSAAEKLFKAMTALQMPLTNSLYPYMSKSRDVRAYRKIFTTATVGNAALCLLVFVLAYPIVSLIYGAGFELSASLLRMFAILTCIMVPSALLGYPLLAALGHSGYANYSVVAAAVIHLLLLLVAIPILSPHLVVVFLIITQLIVLAIRVVGVRRHLTTVLAS
ncbi:flippase [candidate division GN15 bacterium]|uniref:Flippase n=1 Tax=candidate division GN15 bacterium TaxID=2072418 RepID=A0A855WZV5_9BACT|nr:MAG: flippase [candidate division GN15 bacterium]